MKKQLIAAITAAMLGGAGLAAPAIAQPGGGPGFFGDPAGMDAPGGRWGEAPQPGKRVEMMARQLGLNETQKSKIKQIINEEQEAAKPLRAKLDESRKQLRPLVEAESFDDAAVRAQIAGDEGTRTELHLIHARAINRISAVLTPEQREKAKKLREGKKGGKRPGGGRPF